MKPELSAVLERADDVRYRSVERETVVIRQQQAEALVLSEVAGRILDLLDGTRSLEEVVARLLDEFSVDRAVLEEDVRAYAGELLETGLVLEA